MSLGSLYRTPLNAACQRIACAGDVLFDQEYGDGVADGARLFVKSAAKQWDSSNRLPWGTPLDPENPLEFDDRFIPLHGSKLWEQIGEPGRVRVRANYQAYFISQFLHGEQAALIAASRLVEAVPSIADKKLAAMQVADEARHVDIFERLLREKIRIAYPLEASLASLIDQGLSSQRIDYVLLATQILIEGFALAAFQHMRDVSKNVLVQSLSAYVIEDEARHVALGVQLLEDMIPRLSELERREREQFIAESLAVFRQRLDPVAVWQNAGLSAAACSAYVRSAEGAYLIFRRLMRRILPLLERIGLFSERMQRECALLGLSRVPHVEIEAWLRADEEIAESLSDSRRPS